MARRGTRAGVVYALLLGGLAAVSALSVLVWNVLGVWVLFIALAGIVLLAVVSIFD